MKVFAIFSTNPSGLSRFKNNTDYVSCLIEQSHAVHRARTGRMNYKMVPVSTNLEFAQVNVCYITNLKIHCFGACLLFHTISKPHNTLNTRH